MGQLRNRGASTALAALVLAAGASFSVCAPTAHAENFHYTYNKAAMPLMLEAREVAIFRDTAAPVELARGLERATILDAAAALGINAEETKAMAIPGWVTIDTPLAADRDETETVRDVVFRMANAAVGDFVSPVFMDEYGPVVVTRDLLIGFEADITRAEADRMITNLNIGEITDRDFKGVPGLYRVRSNSRNGFDVLQASNDISFRPEVRYAEPDLIRTNEKHLIPNDSLFNSLWGIRNTGQSGGTNNMDMDGDLAWDITTGDPNIRVVVIDDGCDLNHADLNLAPGLDATGIGTAGGHDPANPCDSHGTLVSGTISAKINNNLGVVGIAPNCRVAPAKFSVSNQPCSGSGTFQISWMVNCITFAQTSGARVTNNSNGFGQNGSIDAAYTSTRTNGVVHFASTGNGGNGTIGYPSSAPGVNAVGSVTRTGARSSFSQFGAGLDIMGPGSSIVTTSRGGGFSTVDGTSFSSPYVAGVAALYLSRNNLLTPTDVENTLFATAKDLGAAGYDTTFGWGLANANSGLLTIPSPSIPNNFALLSPANGALNQPRLPTVTWATAMFASSYDLTIDDDPAFGSPEVSLNTPFTSYTHSGSPLPHDTVFFWRVVAVNNLGMRASTPVSFSFRTISDPPGPFNLTAPANGDTNVALTPSLQWTASSLAESYRVRIDDNSDFSSTVVDFVTNGLTFAPGSPLAPNTTYYWTITAMNPIGNMVSTPASRSFTTTSSPPQPFNLLSPPDGPNLGTRTPTLVWSTSGGASSYNVQADDDIGFGSPEVDTTGVASTSYMIPGGILQDVTRYYWRVTAVNGAGTIGSSPASFSFGVVLPACLGNANGDGVVNFDDITSVLGNWLTVYGVGNTGPGDADRSGTVNFGDITSVLANWGVVCP